DHQLQPEGIVGLAEKHAFATVGGNFDPVHGKINVPALDPIGQFGKSILLENDRAAQFLSQRCRQVYLESDIASCIARFRKNVRSAPLSVGAPAKRLYLVREFLGCY